MTVHPQGGRLAWLGRCTLRYLFITLLKIKKTLRAFVVMQPKDKEDGNLAKVGGGPVPKVRNISTTQTQRLRELVPPLFVSFLGGENH